MGRKRDYGYGGSDGRERPRRRVSLLDLVLLLLSVLLAGLLLLSYLAPWVDPNRAWPIALLGLAAPVLYLANIVLALWWIMRWSRYVIFPLVALVLGFGQVGLFFRPTLRKHYDGQQQEKPALRVMSYNVEGFLNFDDEDRPRPSMDSIGAFMARHNPDVICIQEYQTTPSMPQEQIDRLLEVLPHRTFYYAIPITDSTGWGLAVYSRYPILRKQAIQFPSTLNCALIADLSVQGDTVRVINCHLQSTTLTPADRRFMTSEQLMSRDTDATKQRMKRIAGKLRDNYRIRAGQADSVARIVELSPHPLIVCGDFNDTPLSYAYHTVRGDLRDAFVEKGRGTSNTYHGFFNLFRIDYVLHSEHWRTVNYESPEPDVSDHYPVIAGLSRE